VLKQKNFSATKKLWMNYDLFTLQMTTRLRAASASSTASFSLWT